MIKKIVVLILCAAGFYFPLQAQSVQQGTNIIGLNIRLGIYNTTVTDKGNNNAVGYGRAGDLEYTLSYDRGINETFTLGGQLRYNAFILAKDTTQQQLNVAYGIDVCADGALHFVKSEHVDMYIGAALGFAYLKLANTNLSYQGVYTAGGLAYNLDLGARFYLGNHFAIHLMLGYSGYYYPNGTAAGLGGVTDHLSLFFSGSTYGIGLCYKL